MPRARPTAKPPLKASPAPVVSTTGPTWNGATSSEPPAVWSSAPLSPSVMHARRRHPWRAGWRRRARASSRVSTRRPGQFLGLGLVGGDVVAERDRCASAARPAGAGLRMVVTPAARAISSATAGRLDRLLELGDEDAGRRDQLGVPVDVGGRDQRGSAGRDDDGVFAADLLDEDVGGPGVAFRRLDDDGTDARLRPGRPAPCRRRDRGRGASGR